MIFHSDYCMIYCLKNVTIGKHHITEFQMWQSNSKCHTHYYLVWYRMSYKGLILIQCTSICNWCTVQTRLIGLLIIYISFLHIGLSISNILAACIFSGFVNILYEHKQMFCRPIDRQNWDSKTDTVVGKFSIHFSKVPAFDNYTVWIDSII